MFAVSMRPSAAMGWSKLNVVAPRSLIPSSPDPRSERPVLGCPVEGRLGLSCFAMLLPSFEVKTLPPARDALTITLDPPQAPADAPVGFFCKLCLERFPCSLPETSDRASPLAA